MLFDLFTEEIYIDFKLDNFVEPLTPEKKPSKNLWTNGEYELVENKDKDDKVVDISIIVLLFHV